jgi:hypothetical protein
MTAGSVQALHAGINVNVSEFTIPGQLSASATVDIMPIPGGARILDTVYTTDASAGFLNSAGETVAIASLGAGGVKTFIQAAAAGDYIQANGPGVGVRFTASATLRLTYGAVGSGGSADETCRVITTYITQERGD